MGGNINIQLNKCQKYHLKMILKLVLLIALLYVVNTFNILEHIKENSIGRHIQSELLLFTLLLPILLCIIYGDIGQSIVVGLIASSIIYKQVFIIIETVLITVILLKLLTLILDIFLPESLKTNKIINNLLPMHRSNKNKTNTK